MIFVSPVSGGRGTLVVYDSGRRQVHTPPNVPGASEDGDSFGFSSGCADFDRVGYADVAVGAPCEAVGSRTCSGAVWVLRGGRSGPTTTGVRFNKQLPAQLAVLRGGSSGPTTNARGVDLAQYDDELYAAYEMHLLP